jgi:tetratricopeptide (TPR) repeat protein
MANERIDQALELFYAGDSAGAEVLLQEVGGGTLEPPADLPPLDQAAFWEGVGGLKLVRGDGEPAAQAFRHMIELEEKGGADANGRATSYAKLAEALAAADRLDDAIEAFNTAARMKQECNAPPHSMLNVVYKYAECLFHNGRYKDAETQFAKACDLADAAGADDGIKATLALYHAESIKHLIAPMQASVKVQKGMQGASPPPQIALLEKQLEGQFQQASELFRKAAELADKAGMPEDFKLQIQRSLAEANHDAGRFVKGVMQRKKLIQQAEKLKAPPLELGYMHHGLAESHKEMGQLAEATEAYRRAIALKERGGADPASLGKSWFALGECYAGQKKLDSAIEALSRARDIEEGGEDGNDPDQRRLRRKKYWHTLGLVLQAAGKDAEGKDALEKAEVI